MSRLLLAFLLFATSSAHALFISQSATDTWYQPKGGQYGTPVSYPDSSSAYSSFLSALTAQGFAQTFVSSFSMGATTPTGIALMTNGTAYPTGLTVTHACSAGFTYNASMSLCLQTVSACPSGQIGSTVTQICGVGASEPIKKYVGDNSSTLCLADGTCSGAKAFATPAEACADRATNGVYANAHKTAVMVGTVCKTQMVYDDGTFGTPVYEPIVDAVPCAKTDTTCNATKLAAANAGAASAAAGNASAAAGKSDIAAASAVLAAPDSLVAPSGGSVTSTVGSVYSGTGVPAAKVTVTDFCELHPNSSTCQDLGAAPAQESLPTSAPTFDTASVAFSSSSVCPVPINFHIGVGFINSDYSISFQPFCDVAAQLRPIFLAIGAISAAFIFAAGIMI